MIISRRIAHALSVCLVVCFTLAFGASDVQAQIDTGNATADAGGATGGGGARFEAPEVDLSAFDGVERSESIGAASTQGFGIASETTGGGATGGAARGGFAGGAGGLGGFLSGLGAAFGGQNNAAQKPTIRVRLRSAISVPPRPAEEVQQSASRVLASLPARRELRGVRVKMDGRTAILSGAVATEKDRRMSELLMRLEPGVSRVDNQVVVQP